jgi:thiamine-monophosphate kinase
LIGGDVSRTPDQLVIDSIVGGSVPHGDAILRSGAKPGDGIFVTGPLGGAAAGLKLLQIGARLETEKDDTISSLLLRQLRPNPQLDAAANLRSNSIATAMIDISDGFSSDLAHLCAASQVGATVGNMSVDENLYNHFKPAQVIDMALHGGEDFELLFTVAPEKISDAELLPIFRVGVITPNAGIIEVIRGESKSVLEAKGYRHF